MTIVLVSSPKAIQISDAPPPPDDSVTCPMSAYVYSYRADRALPLVWATSDILYFTTAPERLRVETQLELTHFNRLLTRQAL